MTEIKLQYPGYMERSQGFSIPDNKCFYILSFVDLVYYDLNSGEVTELEDWAFDETRNLILLNDMEIPFMGSWGGTPILERNGIGELSLNGVVVTLLKEDGSKAIWELDNFSGDWAQVTFDKSVNGFLYGAPYDFDYRYISVT